MEQPKRGTRRNVGLAVCLNIAKLLKTAVGIFVTVQHAAKQNSFFPLLLELVYCTVTKQNIH